MKIITHSVDQTIDEGYNFGKKLKGGEVVLLKGDLGAGKTHFSKGVARSLGISEVVTSPTFTLHNVYYGRLTLNHFDFYRVDEDEASMLGLDEFFGQRDSVSLIEWSENIVGLLPKNTISVTITRLDDNSREIIIDG